jgi:hypothetical protein
MTSTPWGRIGGYENVSLDEIRKVVRGVSSIFRFPVSRLINPLQFLELGFGQVNPYIGMFLWVSGMDSLLMAGTSKNFKDRLVNVFGETTFVLPKVDYMEQPRYRVGEVAGDIYELRSAIAHGSLIPTRCLEMVGLEDLRGKANTAYGSVQYLQVMRECALFLLIDYSRKSS